MMALISIKNLSKTYGSGLHALRDVSLDIHAGEIFALLGPNGAGKTTLIGIITGLVTKTSGDVRVDGKDIEKDYRYTRSLIGFVPQEISLDIFLSVEQILKNQRGFYGKPANPALLERIMRDLSLWDKRHAEVRSLSGGMKRRVLIAKALTNEPRILFLDEPTAGVDVDLRKDMWGQVQKLRQSGTTIILTTHYIEEAELLADRIGIINEGKLILVENKETLMKKMGEKTLVIQLKEPMASIPTAFSQYRLTLSEDKQSLSLQYSVEDHVVFPFLQALKEQSILASDITTTETSLEEIFVTLIGKK
ncbi:MAG: ABC transporter ATP-binding protein [Candidatus Moraniibacteriota bacterium]|nr:MAG: ABC transporter ATP-binding protein [Candidatus Moranbacteria bacterium]